MSKMLAFMQANIGKPVGAFVPAFTKWLDGTLLKAEEGMTEVSFVVREEMTNPAGMLHGGIHAAMLDEVIGLTVVALGLSNLYVSVNLTVDFLAPARVGEQVIVRGKVIRKGKTIVNATGEIVSQEGKLLSYASSNLANSGIAALV